jgi:MraZ protein
MFIGEYVHSIDTKKRLNIPAKMRGELGGKAVLTRGLDTCLFIFPQSVWENMAEKLAKLPIGQQDTRSFVRLLLAGAVTVELDQLGRILIPEYLLSYARLKKRIVIAGVYNRLEVWDRDEWQAYKQRAEKETENIAEKLGELGVY